MKKQKNLFHYFSPGKSGKFFIVFHVVFHLEFFPETKAQKKVKNKGTLKSDFFTLKGLEN
jgi:hypothetical protein